MADYHEAPNYLLFNVAAAPHQIERFVVKAVVRGFVCCCYKLAWYLNVTPVQTIGKNFCKHFFIEGKQDFRPKLLLISFG